ncbi:hypothetical protein ACWGY7_00860 [Xanthomonas axonopodis pv. khayae]
MKLLKWVRLKVLVTRLTRITQVVCEDALLCARIAFIELRRR